MSKRDESSLMQMYDEGHERPSMDVYKLIIYLFKIKNFEII